MNTGLKSMFMFAAVMASLSHPLYAAPATALLKGMRLLSAKNTKEACAALEEAYHGKSASAADKLAAAKILALQSNKDLLRGKRHKYAEHALQGSGHEISGAHRDGLLRALGDGYFDEMKLDVAARWYTELAASPDLEQVDYAAYKLGWIDLNTNHPAEAFRRFHQRLSVADAASRPLHSSMVRDLGRTWSESGAQTPGSLEMVNGLQLSSSDKTTLVEGIIAGMRRLKEEKDIARLREVIMQSSVAVAVVNALLSQGMGRASTDCSLLDWVESSRRVADLAKEPLTQRLNACVLEIEKSLKSEDWRRLPNALRLVPLYRELNLIGPSRWVKALLLNRTGMTRESLNEYAALLAEQSSFPVDGDAALNNICAELQELLKHVDPDEARLLVGPLSRALGHAAADNRLGLDKANPRYAVLQTALNHEGFPGGFLEAISSEGTLFVKTLVPALVIEKLPPQVLERKSEVILARLAPDELFRARPDRDVWVKLLQSRVALLVREGHGDDVLALLESKAPLNAAGERGEDTKAKLRIWTQWVVKADPTRLDEKSAAAARAVVALLLPNTNESREAIFALALKFGMLPELWRSWGSLSQAPSLMTAILKQSATAWLDGGLKDADLILSSAGRGLLHTCRMTTLTGSELALAVRSIDSEMIRAIPDLALIASLQKQGEALNYGKLRFNNRLPREIEYRVNQLKKQVDRIQAHSWSHSRVATMARRVVAASCDGFIADLKGLENPDLMGLITMIQGLRTDLSTLQGGL